MKFMLDTNIVIYAKNNNPAAVYARFSNHRPEDMCISAISMAELEYGMCRSAKPTWNRTALLTCLTNIRIMPFDADAAREYGDIRADLAARGTPIGANDLLIAAHARALGLILVTNNTREFARVPGLKVENWV